MVRGLFIPSTHATIPPAKRQTLTHRVKWVEHGKPNYLHRDMESNPQGMPIGKWVWDVGGSKGQPVTGWIGGIPWPERVLTSDRCFGARKLAEPCLKGKANEATWVSYAPFTKMGFGCQCVSQRWLATLNHWVFLMQRQAFEVLEPCAGKLASSVLRGRSGSNATLLPDFQWADGRHNIRDWEKKKQYPFYILIK